MDINKQTQKNFDIDSRISSLLETRIDLESIYMVSFDFIY